MKHWKPILLITRGPGKQSLVYLTVQRTATGFWFIHVRSLNPRSVLPSITVRVELFKADLEDSSPMHVYERRPITNKTSHDESVAAGTISSLNDAKVWMMKDEEKFFSYKVWVTVDPNIERVIYATRTCCKGEVICAHRASAILRFSNSL